MNKRKRRKNRKIKVVYRKLGREHVHGLYWADGLIEIDKRLKGKRRMKICIHECLHAAFLDVPEYKILKAESLIGNVLWQENYRKVDN